MYLYKDKELVGVIWWIGVVDVYLIVDKYLDNVDRFYFGSIGGVGFVKEGLYFGLDFLLVV